MILVVLAVVRSLSPRARARALQALLAAAAALIVSLPSSAFAQTVTVCGPEVKAEVVKALTSFAAANDTEQLAFEKELYAKYQFCVQDAQYAPASFFAAARECGAAVSNLGSLFYEELPCAGYDP